MKMIAYPYELQHVLLAEGDQGAEQWKTQFNSIEQVREILCRLDDIGAGQVDWNNIVGNCNYFKGLSRLRFPPLYGLDGFADLSDDFLHVLDPPEDDDTPNQSFNRSRLYLKKDKASVVENEFSVFLEHLKSGPANERQGRTDGAWRPNWHCGQRTLRIAPRRLPARPMGKATL